MPRAVSARISAFHTGVKSQIRHRPLDTILREGTLPRWGHSVVAPAQLSSSNEKSLERCQPPAFHSQGKPHGPIRHMVSKKSNASDAIPRLSSSALRSTLRNHQKQRPPLSSDTKRFYTSRSPPRPMLEHIKATTDTPTIITTQSNNPAQTTPKYWSHRLPKTPNITVHYCKTLASTEEIAQKFLQDKVLGLDLEWKANAPASDGILSNVSMIQLANESRIALFHLALFKPARGRQHLVSPTLKRIIESPDITKVGVSIKADCTRLRKFLNIHARAIFELSHLYRLVKYCRSEPKNVNKRLVSLTQQVEEYFGLPLAKDEDVRCGDWTTSLAYSQVHYAAADPYACYRLFHAMNEKRLALEPVPPLPAHAELDLPIRIVCENPVVESDVKIETHVSRGDRALD